MSLEVLDLAFVLPGRFKSLKRAQIAPLSGGILLPRIQAKLTRFEFPYHAEVDASATTRVAR